jgi:hypothetical protein
MTNLNEYKIQIKNDADLSRWKSTWEEGQPIPTEVVQYVRTVILPRITKENASILLALGIK